MVIFSSSSSDGHSGKGQVAEPHRILKNTMDQVKEQQTKGIDTCQW